MPLTKFIAGSIGLMMTYETMPNTGRAHGALAGRMQALIWVTLLSGAATEQSPLDIPAWSCLPTKGHL